MLRTLLVIGAGVAAATVALAQGEPGAGSPAAPHGEPYAPNTTIAPGTASGAAATGTQASTLSNPVAASADGDRGTTDKWRSDPRHRHPNTTSVGGVSDRAPSSRPLPPTSTPPQ